MKEKQQKLNYGLHIETTLLQVREASGAAIVSPASVADMFRELSTAAQETLCLCTLNVRNRVIGKHLVTLGLADKSLVHPREVFRLAISDGASSVILIHNHPSGDVGASAEDASITRGMIDAGKVLKIPVLDHIIIGRSTDGGPWFASMRESCGIQFGL